MVLYHKIKFYGMKELFFYVLVAIGCAYGTVWLLLQANTAWGLSEMWFFPDVLAFIHGYGYSMRVVAMFAFFAFYLLSGLHRWVARGLFNLVIWTIILMVAIAAIVALYKLLFVLAEHL